MIHRSLHPLICHCVVIGIIGNFRTKVLVNSVGYRTLSNERTRYPHYFRTKHIWGIMVVLHANDDAKALIIKDHCTCSLQSLWMYWFGCYCISIRRESVWVWMMLPVLKVVIWIWIWFWMVGVGRRFDLTNSQVLSNLLFTYTCETFVTCSWYIVKFISLLFFILYPTLPFTSSLAFSSPFVFPVWWSHSVLVQIILISACFSPTSWIIESPILQTREVTGRNGDGSELGMSIINIIY